MRKREKGKNNDKEKVKDKDMHISNIDGGEFPIQKI